jgi:enoyl-CoA hydratase/carnithine racemase
MLCDIRIVSETAKIQYAMVRRGIIPELGSHVLLPRVIGFSRAAELMLTGRLIMGTEAAEMGLASRAVPAGQVLTTALEMARDIAINVAPVSAAIAKKLMWDGMNTTLDAMIATEGNLLPVFTAAADSGEGVRAFFEKRTPEWQSCVSKDMPSILE